MARKQMTPEQLEKQKARRAAFAKLAGQISSMSPETRAEFAARIPAIVTVEGRALSIFNQCLVATQAPSATIVGGFRQWLDAGRCVRKGEHGLMIWCPTSKKDKETPDAESETYFIPGTVFDVSQTFAIGEAEPEAKPEPIAAEPEPAHRSTAEEQGYHVGGYYSEQFTAM